MTVVYSYYVLDILHAGHIHMLRNAKRIAGADGISIVGILTDSATLERKPKPIMSFEERMELARAVRYADVVVPQETYSPLPNVVRLRPQILLESTSHSPADIADAERTMASIGGSVLVIPYWPFQSSTQIKNAVCSQATSVDVTAAP